jgi:hypothetical protein
MTFAVAISNGKAHIHAIVVIVREGSHCVSTQEAEQN